MRNSAKKNLISVSCAMVVATASLLGAQESQSDAKNSLLITKALLVIEEFMQSPDKKAAEVIMRNCAAVAVFPSVYKGAFFVGAQYGRGVMCSYDPKTGTWSSPAFFSVGAGSLGLQFGAEATDLILVIANQRGLESLLRKTVTLGTDISAAAGPVGRQAQAETDISLQAGIYSYSRSKGIFAGFSLKGAVLSPDMTANQAYYGAGIMPEDILIQKKIKPKGPALELTNALQKFIE